MEKSFSLRIVTPDREFFSGEVHALTVQAADGERGILYQTYPLVTVLKAGVLRIRVGERVMEAANADGIVTVLPEGVTVLTLSCAWPHEAEAATVDKETALRLSRERKERSLREYKMAKAQLGAQFAKLKSKSED